MNTQALGTKMLGIVNSAEQTLQRVSIEESATPALAGGWSRRQLIGHLIDSASNNHQRFVRASLQDSLTFPEYDQNGWSRVQAPDQAEWPVLVALWANYNPYLAHVVTHLPSDKLEVPVQIGEDQPMTVKELAEDYLRHMLHHLKQIDAAPKHE